MKCVETKMAVVKQLTDFNNLTTVCCLQCCTVKIAPSLGI